MIAILFAERLPWGIGADDRPGQEPAGQRSTSVPSNPTSAPSGAPTQSSPHTRIPVNLSAKELFSVPYLVNIIYGSECISSEHRVNVVKIVKTLALLS